MKKFAKQPKQGQCFGDCQGVTMSLETFAYICGCDVGGLAPPLHLIESKDFKLFSLT